MIRKALKHEFNSVSGLSGKVFPVKAQEGTEAPYLTYQLQDNERHRVQNGFDGLVDIEFEIDIFHSTYASLVALKNLVIAKVKTFQNSSIGTEGLYCQSVIIDDEFEEWDEDTNLYHGQITIILSYNEN